MTKNTKDTIQISYMKIKFDFKDMKWQGITVSQLKLWERLYPDIDVDNEIQVEMIRWLDKRQGTKIVLKKNWKTFISNWLKRSQERSIR